MSEIVLKGPRKITIKAGELEFQVRRPTMGEALDLERRMKEPEEGKRPQDYVIDLFVSCGLPKDFLLSLDVEDFETIADAMRPKKKP